jgi:hypothetical protein
MTLRYGRVAVVCVLLLASLGVGVSTAAAPTASLGDESLAQVDGGLLSDLEETLQNIDEFLETVVDLVRTINELTGEGEGGD